LTFPYSLSKGAACRDSLSAYRASLVLVTCAAILGVDFHAFPRRFAKAETFGTGLMDAGVGAFVAAGGLAQGFSAAGRDGEQGPQRAAWARQGLRALALLALGGLAAELYIFLCTGQP
jgi:phosphatidylinositol glycan class W